MPTYVRDCADPSGQTFIDHGGGRLEVVPNSPLPAWSVGLNHPDTINAFRGEPPISITIAAENWDQAKAAWADLLETNGQTGS